MPRRLRYQTILRGGRLGLIELETDIWMAYLLAYGEYG